MGRRTVKISVAVRAALLAAAAWLLLMGCPNPMRDTLENVVKDYSTPQATASPADGMGIAETTPIVITFSETMDTTSLTLGGNMPAESDGGVWTSGTSRSDTLTISPTGTWTRDSGRALVVNCRDLQGYDAVPVVLNYGVLDGVVYVHAVNGDDANPGTPDKPKKTIPAAIKNAGLCYAAAEVHVAAGVYNVSYQAGTHVVMRQGISLYGGYNPADWAARDPSVFVSKIKDTSSQASSNKKNRALDCGQNLTSATVIDGFTIEGGSDPSTTSVNCAVDCNTSAPTIQNCVVDGGLGDTSVGIRVISASPTVLNCTIDGGLGGSMSVGIHLQSSTAIIRWNTVWANGGSDCYSIFCDGGTPLLENNAILGSNGLPVQSFGIGLYNSDAQILRNTISGGSSYSHSVGIECQSGSAAVIRNNTIYGGTVSPTASALTTGIWLINSNTVIQNNTICGGNPGALSSSAYGVVMSGSSPDIRNNIVFCVAGVQQIGFWEQTTNHPAFFNNNDVFACPTALYYLNGDGYQNNFTDMNASFTWCSGNDCVDPLFASTNGPDENCQDVLDNDWRLTASSPASVKTGGLDLGALFTVDRDNVTRTGDGTTGWSIGAYEY